MLRVNQRSPDELNKASPQVAQSITTKMESFCGNVVMVIDYRNLGSNSCSAMNLIPQPWASHCLSAYYTSDCCCKGEIGLFHVEQGSEKRLEK